jgi:hypothetical protein
MATQTTVVSKSATNADALARARTPSITLNRTASFCNSLTAARLRSRPPANG